MIISLDLIIGALAFVGLLIALYISHTKKKKRPLVCPLRGSCDPVIHSDHSRFLGMPVELLGVGYYFLTVLLHALFLVFPSLVTEFSVFISFLFSLGAALFSLYLIFIQAIVIKHWCTWCVFSAIVSFSIFLFVVIGSPIALMDIFVSYSRFFTIMHLLGVALGVGTATITDIFFFSFLKDYKISIEESRILKTLSNVIWFALALLLVSGITLFVPKSAMLLSSGKFLVKLIAVATLITNGFILNIVIAPKLVKITFGEIHQHLEGELHHLRKLSFALGAVSITSWYFVFVLGALRGVLIPFLPLLLGYLAILAFAIIGSQIFDYVFVHKKFTL